MGERGGRKEEGGREGDGDVMEAKALILKKQGVSVEVS